MGFIDQEGWEPNFGSWSKNFFNAACESLSLLMIYRRVAYIYIDGEVLQSKKVKKKKKKKKNNHHKYLRL